MNRSQALKEAARRWGNKAAAVRDDGPSRPSSPELRAAASAKLKELNAAKTKDETKEAREERMKQLYLCGHYRYTVGTVMTMCGLSGFFVRGQGDTWEEAFAKADNKSITPQVA
jgi:hypothetical protein